MRLCPRPTETALSVLIQSLPVHLPTVPFGQVIVTVKLPFEFPFELTVTVPPFSLTPR